MPLLPCVVLIYQYLFRIIVSREATNVNSEEIFHLRVSQSSLHISYLPLTSTVASELSIPSTSIVTNVWYHISLAVYQDDLSVYLNGVIQFATSLIASIKGPAGVLYLGRDVNGENIMNNISRIFTLILNYGIVRDVFAPI